MSGDNQHKLAKRITSTQKCLFNSHPLAQGRQIGDNPPNEFWPHNFMIFYPLPTDQKSLAVLALTLKYK